MRDLFGETYWRSSTTPSFQGRKVTPDQVDQPEYRAIADNLPSLCWIASADGYIYWYNRRWHEYCGSTPAEMEGWGWQSAHDPDILPAVSERWRGSIAAGEPFEMVFPLRGADGVFRPFLTRIVPLNNENGVPQRWIGNNVDISAQRGIEDELRAARDELHELNRTLETRVAEQTRERDTLWQTSRDPFLVADLEGRWLRVSPAWGAILGWSDDELLGRTSEWMEHPDDHDKTRAEVRDLAAGSVTRNFVNRLRAGDGEYRWFSWMAVEDGDNLFCVARDITAERRAADERAMLEEQLRQSQKLEAIGQLTGGVAHDFNNLLTVIRGSVDLLRRDDLPDEKRARYIDAIGTTADRAAKLTGQLLAFARRQALTPVLFDVGVSLRETVEIVSTLTGSRIAMEVRIPEDGIHIRADRSQFETAIINMCLNARDAMKGEGSLTIATGPVSGVPTIRGHAPVAGDFIAIMITDTGSGIAPAVVDQIFEPFFTTKDVGQGTGLGLSQVIGFAKQSGGDIRADSVVGTGTTFSLYLPRGYAETSPAAENSEIDKPADGAGACVLVVEDNAEVGEFATQALRELGYDTLLAADAAAALAELSKDSARFHVVFSDVVMPGMSGVELGEEIRRLYSDVPIILTSGYSHVLAQNGKHGFELLHKPYSVEQLSRALRKAIVRPMKRSMQ